MQAGSSIRSRAFVTFAETVLAVRRTFLPSRPGAVLFGVIYLIYLNKMHEEEIVRHVIGGSRRKRRLWYNRGGL